LKTGFGDEVQEPDPPITVSKVRRGRSFSRRIKALRPQNPGVRGDFSLSYAPFENAWKIKMLEASLSQLEQLVSDLVQQNQSLLGSNQALSAELAQAKDENESLQLSLMEQEEKHGATAARIQALVERVSAGPVSA
jgi:phage shock protein A